VVVELTASSNLRWCYTHASGARPTTQRCSGASALGMALVASSTGVGRSAGCGGSMTPHQGSMAMERQGSQ
jgi:hypothetical protein